MNVAELLAIPSSIVPDQPVIWFEGKNIAYAELAAEVARTSGALYGLGVRPGDRVAVLETNTPAALTALFAATAIGATCVPLNYRAGADELPALLAVATPRVLLVGDRYIDLACESATDLQVVTLDSPRADLPHLASLAHDATSLEAADVEDDVLAVLMFTSGTTARPKAAMLAHADLTNYVLGVAEPPDGEGGDATAVLLAAPLYHIAGLMGALVAVFSGRRIVLIRQFDAEEWLRLVPAERITHSFLVPTMVKRVMDHPGFADADLSSLRVLSYGAAPMPPSLIRRAIERFPSNVQFINAFGQTETTSTVTMLGPADHRLVGTPSEVELKVRRLASVGKALPDVEICILNDDGQPVATGQVGEIAIRSGRLMRGYYGESEPTRATLRNGWLRTRDLGWLDEDGYLFLTGRKSDMIIRGGENIAPEEVELVLQLHPSVEEAVVFGLPDEEWGERVAALIVLQPGGSATAEELIDFGRQRLASFKKPEQIYFGTDVPRNALGKVLRNDLKARFGAADAV